VRVNAKRGLHIRMPHLCLQNSDRHRGFSKLGRQAMTERVQARAVINRELPPGQRCRACD